jgi:hypothetical protein
MRGKECKITQKKRKRRGKKSKRKEKSRSCGPHRPQVQAWMLCSSL